MQRGKITFGKIGFCLEKPPVAATSSESEEPGKGTTEKESEQNVGGFGSFGRATLSQEVKSSDDNESTNQIGSLMGFSAFGKKSQEFDIEKLVEETRRVAAERNRENLEKLNLQEQRRKQDKGRNSGKDNKASQNDESSEEDDFIGPPLPPSMTSSQASAEKSDSASEDEEDFHLPFTHEMILDHGTKLVSALAVDPSGSRLVSGGFDYDVRYWDFQGMDQAREAFRSFCPAEGYPINIVEYSCTGDKVLIVSGSQQAKVYDRDGIELFECVRGDMYLHDMAKTKGHIAGLTSGAWHPKDKEEFLTAARDGTCRIWHTERPHCQRYVIKARALNGLKTIPTTCAYSRDGLLVACTCDDGSVQMWDHRKTFVNVSVNVKGAHDKGSETSGLVFAYDNKGFATRGGDDTLKLWDIRNIKQPVHVQKNLFNRFSMTNCIFSPNDQYILTGTSLNRGESSGKIFIFNRNPWQIHKELEVGPSHIVRLIWHPRLNQLMIGCGDGKIRILYDKKLSRNGAVLVTGKHKKRVKQAEVVVSQQVITPHALPMFREERHKSTRKLEERDRKDPLKSHQPDLPIGKAGSGGRVSAGGSTLSSYIIRNMGLRNKAHEEGDPREALLKYAKDAAENPYWVTPAYTKNQPVPIFDNVIQEEKSTSDDESANTDDQPATKKIKTG
ncbi:WD repeat-containing protein 70 [Halocaridina rubra]|uniref:WD repeat-containing protein 70 n=1 Tax=Halocaridina rubra TaxID=373956 RepID=A0AAN8XQ54_HALRR